MRAPRAIAAPMLLTALILVSASAKEQQTEVYELDIPRQSLDGALKEFAQQTNYQVAWFADVARADWLVGPVVGAHSMDQALTLLLCQWNLTYRLVNERTLAVVPAPPRTCPATATLTKEM
jgi:outer membrane receptor for ferric coprogen and ferric-rhodotorulic acid